MEKKKVDPKGRIVETKSGRYFRVGEQLETGEVAAASAFSPESLIKETKHDDNPSDEE